VLAAKTKLIPNLAKTNRHLAKAGLHLLSRGLYQFWLEQPSIFQVNSDQGKVDDRRNADGQYRPGNLKKSAEVCMEITEKTN
jgi:hypothetical protein